MERLPPEILQQIAALQEMNTDELLRRYGAIIGYDVKNRRPEPLRKLVAYRLQEQYYHVSLSTKDLAKLRELARERDEREKTVETVPNKEGTRYCRIWRGEEHEAIVQPDGKVSYRGVLYTSLTAVATHITGTHWSGRKFFGVV